MKNLFKNLMLVAVAAMAFTACQNDNDFAGNAAGEGTTTISVVANLDDTRSGFGEKGETGYPSVWYGGEAVEAYVVSKGEWDNYYNVAASNDAVVEAENGATEAHFNLSFNSSLSNGALYIVAAADASVVNCDGTGYNHEGGQKPNITLPTEQTPGDNSVDPKAHILIYENPDFIASQSTDIEATFSHYAAYGKLSLTDFTAEGVTSYVLNINGKMYTINSSKTENVWFACEPATVADMTISVITTDDTTYTKKIVENSNKSLEFVKGQVSTFTVSMEGVTNGEAVDTFNPTYRLESLSWNNSGYFDLVTNYVVNGSTNTSMNLRIYMHADDRPNNNSLKLDDYTCAGTGASTPASAGTVNMRYNANTWAGYHATANTSSTLSVSAENGEYVIIATINGQTWGYKGLPTNWPVPVESDDDNGDEPENPGEGGGGNEPETPGEGGGDEPETPGVEGFEPVTFVSLSKGYFSGRAYYFIAAFEFEYDGGTINVSIANYNTINVTSNNPIPAATYSFVSAFTNDNVMQNSMSQVSVKGNTGTGGNVEVIKDGDIYTLKMTLEYTDPTLGAQTLKVYYHGEI